MSVITVFSGTYCNDEAIIQGLVKQTGYRLIRDAELMALAAKQSGIAETKMERALAGRPSVFNKFTHERERAIANLRLAVAQTLAEDQLLIYGFAGQLIPRDIHHVLSICLIADFKTRAAQAAAALQVAESEAAKLLHKQDEERSNWTKAIFDNPDPWASDLYDMVVPTDKVAVEEIVAAVAKNAGSGTVGMTASTRKAVEEFQLAAQVEIALAQQGHQVAVHAKQGAVTLTINKHVLMLSRLEGELKSIASQVPGVKQVETKVGPGFYQADIYRKQDFTMPSKILLVDDEREFVQTLSERLLMRDMGSDVAYDGESALEVVRQDEPEVMILDLKMPGIDGIEVLRRVKETQPEIEVIILTGHGSEADRDTCMKLGAFAYLQKPVDVEELSATIKRANQKIQSKGAGRV